MTAVYFISGMLICMNVISYTVPEGGGRPENLSELEQRLFYTRVLCTNFSYLYQHLNTPAILAALEEKELIEPSDVNNIKYYSVKYAQNIIAIRAMEDPRAPPNCIDKLCDTLRTQQQDHIADKLLTGKPGTKDIAHHSTMSSSLQNMESWQNMATLSHSTLPYRHLPQALSLLISQVPSSNY